MAAADVFDEPSRWRHEAIDALGLTGEDRIAGAVTGVAYPDALDVIVDAVRADERAADRVVCDVGAGLGGASEWVRARTGARVLALEPEATSVDAVRRLFPQVAVGHARAAALPLAARSCGTVMVLGVLSLVSDVAPTLCEAARVVERSGLVAVSDLCAAGGVEVAHGRNVFRTVADLAATMAALGLVTVAEWSAPADRETAWVRTGERVDAEIDDRHGDDEAYGPWAADRRALGRLIAAGSVAATTIVSRQQDGPGWRRPLRP